MAYPKQTHFTPIDNGSSGDIIAAIQINSTARCKEILSANPECLHKKGWNQMTPLHVACLSGSLEIVKLLTGYGADTNAFSSFNETPLHYACRRGALDIVHFLLQNGGDRNARDKRGRTCMHFAAIGGSVAMLHYLHSCAKLEYDVPDDTGRNPLHICCEHRHSLGANYLLKNGRVNPGQADLRGNTPLHIVAEHGFGDLVWILLKAGHCKLLNAKNQAGHTPCDIVKQGKTSNHERLVAAFERFSKQDPNQAPKGPLLMWYFLILFPFTYMAMIFLLAAHMDGYSGHFSAIMSIFLVIYVIRQSHRMRDISGWPNPIFMSSFVGGILHCVIAQYFKLQAALWPCPALIIFSTILGTASCYFLWVLLFKDPGVDRTAKICPTTGRPMTVVDIAEGRCRSIEFCAFSEMIHGDRTKYCRICENPMLEMDHHCLFLNNCVAKNNHRHFIVFLLLVVAMQLLLVSSVIMYLTLYIRMNVLTDGLGDPLTPYFFYMYRFEPWLFVLFVLCSACMIWEGGLIYTQLLVIAKGNTTYFATRNPKCSSHVSKKQMAKNLFLFFVQPIQDLKFSTNSVDDVALLKI